MIDGVIAGFCAVAKLKSFSGLRAARKILYIVCILAR